MSVGDQCSLRPRVVVFCRWNASASGRVWLTVWIPALCFVCCPALFRPCGAAASAQRARPRCVLRPLTHAGGDARIDAHRLPGCGHPERRGVGNVEPSVENCLACIEQSGMWWIWEEPVACNVRGDFDDAAADDGDCPTSPSRRERSATTHLGAVWHSTAHTKPNAWLASVNGRIGFLSHWMSLNRGSPCETRSAAHQMVSRQWSEALAEMQHLTRCLGCYASTKFRRDWTRKSGDNS